ncbi:MAG: WXG100 family type VII secretion target [Planctomycetaceae bacterium]|jgi:uncharacterized protein YukE|nr:WXG100 family type VII secretion target [Planctomycetaceae bacterium]
MSQIFANPDELERFASVLSAYLETITDTTNSLNGEFQGLGDTWQDSQRQRFEETFNTLLQSIATFRESAQEQIPYLAALVARLREYAST